MKASMYDFKTSTFNWLLREKLSIHLEDDWNGESKINRIFT